MSETISIKLPVRMSLADLDRAAECLGMSRNQYITTTLEFYMGLDPGLLGMLECYSASLRLPPATLAHAILIRRFAEVAAKAEVRGEAVAVFDELVFTASGLKTGAALFDELKARFLRQERARLFEELAKREDRAGRRARVIERLIAEAGLNPEEADAVRAAMVENLLADMTAEAQTDPADPGGQERS